MSRTTLLRVRGLFLESPAGRPLFRDLSLTLAHGERVALVGRNGAGKSSLLDALAGNTVPKEGQITCTGSRLLVPQEIHAAEAREERARQRDCQPAPHVRHEVQPGVMGMAGMLSQGQSPGEIRRQLLSEARDACPDLLLLDEPTHDLDADNVGWLVEWLRSWTGALLVVSHDRRVLRTFDEFCVVAESGCSQFSGTFDALLDHLNRESELQQARYVRNLSNLLDKEKHSATDRRRRQRKKNLGRVHEVGRCPSRIKLNDKRSYAQVKQGKRAVRREARLGAAREWARSTRRALAVELPLRMVVPPLPEQSPAPIATLDSVCARTSTRTLFAGISLRLAHDRLGITGANGSGKTALVEILTGEREPDVGRALCDVGRIGYIAQNSSNWCSHESVIEHLLMRSDAASIELAARILQAHKFPFALAERPLISLSPGERLRAALICLWQRRSVPELLVLDEPTSHLDFVGTAALQSTLAAWSGGLVIVCHDDEFLQAVGVERCLRLG